MTPSTSSVLPFRFRPRQERVDWRRINTVDVDLVVSQLDVDVLQEHITNVTFCSLEDERCQRCHSQLDPVLVKLLRLAQLSIEWLMHCQEFHAVNLRVAEERVAAGHKEQERLLAQQKEQEERVAAGSKEQERLLAQQKEQEERVAAGSKEQERLLAQQKEQEEKVKMLTAELKQRRKIIKMQQSMLNTKGQKCPHCEKRFINTTFLQSHKQRRHPEEYEMELQSISEVKAQNKGLKLEISDLKEQIIQQQQDLQTRTDLDKKWDDRLQEIKTQHESETNKLLNKLSRMQSENNQRLQEDMSKELQSEQNIQRLQELQENDQRLQEELSRMQLENNQWLREEMSRRLQEQQENKQRLQELQENDQRLQEELSRMQSEYNQRLQEEMNRMQSKYDQWLQEEMNRMQSEYDQWLQEEMNTMQSKYDHQLQEEMNRMQSEYDQRLQEKEQTIEVQRKRNRNISSHPPTEIKEVPVMVSAPAPEPKTKRVRLEMLVSAPKLDPVQEMSEEEEDSSTVSERRPVVKKPEPVPEKRKPKIKKEIRLKVVQALNEKLENLEDKPDQTRLEKKKLNSILAKLHSDRYSIAKRVPNYWHHREEIKSTVEQLVSKRRVRDSAPKSQTRWRQSVQDSSSVSERRPVVKKPEPVPQKRKPKIKREMCLNVVQALNEKLENLEAKPDQTRLKKKKLNSILAKVHSKLKWKKGVPDFRHHLKEINSTMKQLAFKRRVRDSAPESQTRLGQSVQVSQILPTKMVVTKMESDEEYDEHWLEINPKPKPSPESQQSTLSSPEESEEEDPKKEQPQIHQRGKSPQPRQTQIQTRASKTSPVQTMLAPAMYSSPNFHQTKEWVTETVITNMESDEEDDEDCLGTSDVQEIDPKPLHNRRDQNGNVENRNFGQVSQILPTKMVVTKMESDDEDDWTD